MLAIKTWCAPAEHRVLAARLVWFLSPIAESVGAFASAELQVCAGGVARRPDVALVKGEPPTSGRLDHPAELIIVLGADDPGAWLAAGTRMVWRLEPEVVVEHSRGGTRRASGGVLRVPGVPGARIPVEDLLSEAGTVPRPARAASPRPARPELRLARLLDRSPDALL
jgi:hypothetical protein